MKSPVISSLGVITCEKVMERFSAFFCLKLAISCPLSGRTGVNKYTR